jgi:hypothetical protein
MYKMAFFPFHFIPAMDGGNSLNGAGLIFCFMAICLLHN